MTIRSINTSGLPQGVLTPMGDLLFAASEPGAWYDPSDLSTLFQDTAGTVPVTAVEQAVALVLDKSGRGNHATQATSTKRPKYSRRTNQLTSTETCAGSDWSLTVGVTLEANAAPSPIGPSTATIVTTSGGSYHAVAYKALVWSGGVTREVDLKKGNWRYVGITDRRQDGGGVVIDFDTGTVLGNSRFLSPTVVPLGDGWFRVGFSVSDYAAVFQNGIVIQFFTGQSTSPQAAVGLVGATVIIRAASFTLATDAHLPYQWVNTDTDYDADPAKFPAYLSLDGVDDALSTGNIDFTGTDKMTVWAGVDRVSGAPTGFIVESSYSFPTFNGAFALLLHNALGYEFASRGTVLSDTAFNAVPAAYPSIVAASFDIGGGQVTRRVNSQQSVIAADQGTGQYGNHPLFIGARGGNAIYLNGRIYSLIVRGAQSSLSQIEATEAYIKQKMRLP